MLRKRAKGDEAMMAAEEGEAETARRAAEWYWLLEVLLVYLFANNNARQWQGVAVRAAFVIRRCALWLLAELARGVQGVKTVKLYRPTLNQEQD